MPRLKGLDIRGNPINIFTEKEEWANLRDEMFFMLPNLVWLDGIARINIVPSSIEEMERELEKEFLKGIEMRKYHEGDR